jgi:hypothetical protein
MIYKTYDLPVMTYDAETWTQTKRDVRRLKERNRKILGYFELNKKQLQSGKQDIRQKLKVQIVQEKLVKLKTCYKWMTWII